MSYNEERGYPIIERKITGKDTYITHTLINVFKNFVEFIFDIYGVCNRNIVRYYQVSDNVVFGG